MKHFLFSAVALAAFFLVSCAGLSPQKGGFSPVPEMPPVIETPMPPERIMGKGMVSGDNLAAFLQLNNAFLENDFIHPFTGYYIEEAALEGVNHDVAFAQMCLETGFLRFGGLVTPDMNNFCGLGSTGLPGPNGPERGLVFPDPRTGVRAHIQHLKAYATDEPLNQELVDSRYRYVKLGSSPTIQGLTGTWAVDKMYSEKIAAILQRLYDFSFEK